VVIGVPKTDCAKRRHCRAFNHPPNLPTAPKAVAPDRDSAAEIFQRESLVVAYWKEPPAMTTYVALLRAVNLGPRNPIAMSDLRSLLTELGFVGVRSLLQSGNLVFQTNTRTGAELERLLEAETVQRLDLHTDFFVRTAEELKGIVAHNPFRDEAERDPVHLVVMFLKSVPVMKDVEALQASVTGPEIVRANGRQAYIVYPDGIGRSRLTNTVIERRLVTRGTARNWNTVQKLAALAAA
jgi:uncharacterized protein (DUF1697 family)